MNKHLTRYWLALISVFKRMSIRLIKTGIEHYRLYGFKETLKQIKALARREAGLNNSTNSGFPSQYFTEYSSGLQTPTKADEKISQASLVIIGALDLPQCKKYRVIQKIEQLALLSINVEVSSQHDIYRAFNLLQTASSVLFYRVQDDQNFKACLEEARRLGLRVGYDIDDPIFSTDIYEENKNLSTLSASEREGLLSQASKYLSAIKQVDFIVGSTPGMVALLEECANAPVFLWRNCLDSESLDVIDAIRAEEGVDQQKKTELVIAYMSGSRAHDYDFAEAAEAISKALHDNVNVTLLVAGYAQLPKQFTEFESRIRRFPFVGYDSYFRILKEADIVVIPLVIDRFNECKSAIRYLEAAALGRACVVSNVGDFKPLIKQGENALLVSTGGEWNEALELLLSSKEQRERLGEKAFQSVCSEQSYSAIAASLPNSLIEFIKGK